MGVQGAEQCGCPARAGMDPTATATTAPVPRLPRTRGDGPKSHCTALIWARAAPHARGWTLNALTGSTTDYGCPARAGMDRHVRVRRDWDDGLPRTRGDGPYVKQAEGCTPWAAPHARGWTRRQDHRQRARDGCPARAGMDPAIATIGAAILGLPRTRGDGPHTLSDHGRFPKAAPHARGWTPVAMSRSKP